MRCFLTMLLWIFLLPSSFSTLKANPECRVIQDRCHFPFSHNGLDYHSCIEAETLGLALAPQNMNNSTMDYFYCKQTYENRWAWGVCNEDCVDNANLTPTEFGGDMAMAASKCKNTDLLCVFPFKYKGNEYQSCTDFDSINGDFWCATWVDENGDVLPGMWGICDMNVCQLEKSDVYQDLKMAEVIIEAEDNPHGINAYISFHQTRPDFPVTVVGSITGLAPGNHGFHIHEDAATGVNCLDAGGHFNPLNQLHGDVTSNLTGTFHAGDLGNVFADDTGVAKVDIEVYQERISLYVDDPLSIIGRALVIHELEDDYGRFADNKTSITTGNAGKRLACGIIVEKIPTSVERNVTLIIIIVVVVLLIIILLTTIIICLCIKCCKKKQGNKKKNKVDYQLDNEDVPSRIPYVTKKPLYDELSIPFIDATPVGTPKTRRSMA